MVRNLRRQRLPQRGDGLQIVQRSHAASDTLQRNAFVLHAAHAGSDQRCDVGVQRALPVPQPEFVGIQLRATGGGQGVPVGGVGPDQNPLGLAYYNPPTRIDD
jgi:hypothetical protein